MTINDISCSQSSQRSDFSDFDLTQNSLINAPCLGAKRKAQSKVSNRQKVLTFYSSSNSHTTHHIVSTSTNEPKFKAVKRFQNYRRRFNFSS